jgi:hypothetical protein
MACLSEMYFHLVATDWSDEGQAGILTLSRWFTALIFFGPETAYGKGKALLEAGCTFSEFGTRRRRSYLTQDIVVQSLIRASTDMPDKGKVTGTSNVGQLSPNPTPEMYLPTGSSCPQTWDQARRYHSAVSQITSTCWCHSPICWYEASGLWPSAFHGIQKTTKLKLSLYRWAPWEAMKTQILWLWISGKKCTPMIYSLPSPTRFQRLRFSKRISLFQYTSQCSWPLLGVGFRSWSRSC